jgi:hypothetical protein
MPYENQSDILTNLVDRLVHHAYQELTSMDFRVSWAKLHSYAEVHWSDEKNPIIIKCDSSVTDWHDAAITGLLAHELSHPAQESHRIGENQTDNDVIRRGLGVFLAFERAISGRYNDNIVNRGRDRYLGYESIRGQLDHYQKKQLDRLMEWRRVKAIEPKLVHDSVIVTRSGGLVLSIGGYIFKNASISPQADIKFVIRDSRTYVYADDTLIGQLDAEL